MSSGPRGDIARLLLVGLVALALRCAFIAVDRPWPAVSDGVDYERIAGFLLAGQGFGGSTAISTSHRPPLQAFYRAGVRWLIGSGERRAELVQALVGAVACVALADLAAGLAGSAAGLLAGLGLACYPRHIEAAVRHWSLSENLFIALLLIGLACFARAEAGGAGWQLCAAGAALGLAILTRPVLLAFPVVAAGVALRGRGAARPLLFLAAAAVVIAPWTLRNASVQHAFVPVSTMTGVVLWQGVHPSPHGFGFTPWDEILAAAQAAGAMGSEVELSAFLTRAALAEIVRDPGRAFELALLKLAWLLVPWSGPNGALDPAFVLVAGLASLGLMRRRALGLAEHDRVLVALLGYVVAMAVIFYGSARFRLPVEPVLLLYAAVWCSRSAAWRSGRLATLAVVAATLALWIGSDAVRERSAAVVQRLFGA